MKRRLLLSLLMVGLLFSCNGKNVKNTGNIDGNTKTTSNYEEDEQGLAFYLLDDGTYGVGIGNAYYLSNIVVPSSHNGRTVSRVINHGFGGEILSQSKPTVKTITLPETIIEIDECGINYLEHLELVKLPKSLKKICDNGLYGNYALKEIQYNGSSEEFNQIEFGNEWLLSEGYDERVELSFTFSDKSITLDSLFNQLVLFHSYYPSNDDTRKIETLDIQFRSTSYKTIFCFLTTSKFGKLYKKAKNTTLTIENPDIARETEEYIYGYEREYSFSLCTKGVVGSTKLNFAYENLTKSITFNATPDIPITIADVLELFEKFATDRETYYSYENRYYCIEEVYVAEIVNSNYYSQNTYRTYNAYLKDNLDSESTLLFNFRCATEITESDKIRLDGCVFNDNYLYNDVYEYSFSTNVFATIL